MRRERDFLAEIDFVKHDYASIVQTDYPGAHDQSYRQRVDGLNTRSEEHWPELPRYAYTAEENETWEMVSKVLLTLQNRYSCQAYLEGRDALDLPLEYIPQLDDVSAKMEQTTGFMLAPVGGLLDKAEFLPMLANASCGAPRICATPTTRSLPLNPTSSTSCAATRRCLCTGPSSSYRWGSGRRRRPPSRR